MVYKNMHIRHRILIILHLTVKIIATNHNYHGSIGIAAMINLSGTSGTTETEELNEPGNR